MQSLLRLVFLQNKIMDKQLKQTFSFFHYKEGVSPNIKTNIITIKTKFK
jgi:hypothetical protein